MNFHHRLILCVLVSSLVGPSHAFATEVAFSPSLAAKNTSHRTKDANGNWSAGRYVPFPDLQIVCGEAALSATANDPTTITCTAKMINAAGDYCAFIASGISSSSRAWQYAKIPILLLSVAGTALGVSSIASAKSWAAVGGTSGIASSWNSETTNVSGDANARVTVINNAAQKLSGLDITDAKNLTTAISIATQCGSAAGQGTPNPAGTNAPAPK